MLRGQRRISSCLLPVFRLVLLYFWQAFVVVDVVVVDMSLVLLVVIVVIVVVVVVVGVWWL
jgi:hypothetical protein